ncbi:MAG: hypothetical protein ACR2P7_09075 [bacterium]
MTTAHSTMTAMMRQYENDDDAQHADSDDAQHEDADGDDTQPPSAY